MTDLAAEALDRDAAYRRGFDHGRLRAAEDVAKLIDAFNGETRDAYLKAARVALNGYAGALRAPSEPVQGQPRVWELPTIPEDVTAVRDNEGSVWVRAEEPERWWDRADGRRISAESRLIDERGPLTEVVNTDRPYGVHGPGGYRSSACLHAAEPGREELHLVCQTDAIRYDGSEKIAAQCKYGDGKEPCRCACHEEATDGD